MICWSVRYSQLLKGGTKYYIVTAVGKRMC